MVEVPALKVPELEKMVPVPESVRVLELASRVPAVMVRLLLTVVLADKV